MAKISKSLAIIAFAGAVFGFAAPSMAWGPGPSGGSIEVDADVTQRASIGSRSDIDAIASGYKAVGNVGVASVQLVGGVGGSIDIDAEVHQRASVDGDITVVARGSRSVANVGVASIQIVRPR